MNTIERYESAFSTDLYISISPDQELSNNIISKINKDIDEYYKIIKNFETKFSRFINENELNNLNNSTEIKVSSELYELLKLAKYYHKETQGLFNPAILPVLENEGYNVSKTQGFYKDQNNINHNDQKIFNINFDELQLLENNIVIKPLELKIDLGGIGKGYIVDKISSDIKNKYPNYCVNFGGDISLGGEDKKNNYPYWAVEIENPHENNSEKLIMIFSAKSIATSGINRRIWIKNGIQKNHIIDPRINQSTNSDLLSATVIGYSAIYCDIYAKILILLGLQESINYCKINNIEAVLISKNQEIYITESAKKYVFKNQ